MILTHRREKVSGVKLPVIKCNKCGGCGRVPLSPELKETLKALRADKDWTVAEVFSVLNFPGRKFSITAINNRLEDLRKLGLATRKRNGRGFLYSAKPQTKGSK